MRPRTLLNHLLRSHIHTLCTPNHFNLPPPSSFHRTFLTAFPPQRLTASRILPFPAAAIFALIADIPAYPSFLPYLTSAHTLSVSGPDALTRTRWPRAADLRVGWGPYDEVFRSRVFCKPNSIVEAVAGSARCSMAREELPHYYDGAEEAGEESGGEEPGNSVFSSLLTRWTLHEFPYKPPPPPSPKADGVPMQEKTASVRSECRTEVGLVIEVQFASAVYAVLSQAVAPKVAGIMIEAFERRASEVLGEGMGNRERV